VKTILWAASIIGMFFIEKSAFHSYYIASFFFSALFILVQAVLLVRFL
jgi:hypothetical protein